MKEHDIIEAHRAAGKQFRAAGVASFVRDEGAGPAIVCMHGVPSSSFLYRKVLPELATRGLRGVAFDLPGLGLADRPADFDYTWTGLGRFAVAAVDSLGLDRFHLLVHDLGGPVGFELAAAMPERIESLTVLNTLVDVATFKKPWTMRPFEYRRLGAVWLAGMSGPIFRVLMKMQGINDMTDISNAELGAYLTMLKHEDRGRAFLRIMQGFETTAEKQDLYHNVLGTAAYPVQVIWGEHDPALTIETQGEAARRAAGVEIHRLPGKHFLQEDQAAAIADLVAAFVSAT